MGEVRGACVQTAGVRSGGGVNRCGVRVFVDIYDVGKRHCSHQCVVKRDRGADGRRVEWGMRATR